jgi:hypothetical protein
MRFENSGTERRESWRVGGGWVEDDEENVWEEDVVRWMGMWFGFDGTVVDVGREIELIFVGLRDVDETVDVVVDVFVDSVEEGFEE